MAQKVLILGDSGSGKSASLRNFNADEILVINSAGKPLPFRNQFESFTPSFNNLSADILRVLGNAKKKVIVIDDMQYILSFPMMRRIKESGWDKWNDIQGDFFQIIQACDYLPQDVIVYFLSHLQRTEDGHEKIKTVGKMLDEKITIEGLFTVVLKTSVQDDHYYFLTQNSGMDTVKSPIGMFDAYAIDNDLKYVDTKIRNYYAIGDHVSDDEMKALDHEASAPEVEKPAEEKKRTRKRRTAEMNPAEAPAADEKKEEAPKRRTRKTRTEEITSAEETPALEGETKRTRKRRRSAKNTDVPDSMEVIDEDVPF